MRRVIAIAALALAIPFAAVPDLMASAATTTTCSYAGSSNNPKNCTTQSGQGGGSGEIKNQCSGVGSCKKSGF